ncbi:MAG: hypothetical protein KDK28_20565 [Maritimibacter sp.]|nr:hypothetical protein [Maritimibacter sp.]
MPPPDPAPQDPACDGPDLRARRGLHVTLCAAGAVPDETRDEMYALFARAYDGTDRTRFETDLAAKRDVLLLRTGDGRIAGFTTLAVFDETDQGQPIRCVFSGDTLVDPACWGTQALNFAWIRHIASIRAEAPDIPLYWLLISKGFRTYRYLSTFARHYVPGPDGPGDPALAVLRDRLAARLFGAAFDPARGVVSYAPPRDRLTPALADLPRTGRAATEARRFVRLNPGYASGEELVCLCPLDPDNMRPFARRLYARALS